MAHTDPIKSYILYLKQKCGLSVSLHPHRHDALISLGELAAFVIHDNSYCVLVKIFPAASRHCVACQKKVLERAKGGSFCGVCHAGVREYVYPLMSKGSVCGFLSVSGYRSENADSYMEATAQKFSIPRERLAEAYGSLKAEMPSKEEVDTLLHPLCQMLELAYLKAAPELKEPPDTTERVIRYIKKHYTEPISLFDICTHCACSRSHISHQFKKRTGKSVREYLIEVRLESACALLCHSRLSVSEIAFSVGFSDSNYFSSVFKKKIGLAPMAYRKSH